MSTRTVRFPGATGDMLAARLELPANGRPRATALFAHCFTCSKDLRAAVAVTRELAAAGYAVLRFDFTGLGESEGDFADTDFSSNVDDLVAAARWLESEHEAPRLLVGHSLGGAAVLCAAFSLPSVEAVVTIGAPADPAHVLKHVSEKESEIRDKGEATVTLAGRPFTIRESFLRDLSEASFDDRLRELDAALLVMHSPVDATVGIENARRIYDAAKHPKSFVTLDTADHLLSDREDARYAARVLGVWSARYVPALEDEGPGEIAKGDRLVARIGEAGYRTEMGVRGHRLVADEPRSVGGTDEGPTPYDYVVAGLAACTSMTLRMYADRKEWPLEGVTVRLKHDKIHRKDDDDCVDGDPDARLDRIRMQVELEGDLDASRRERLMEIAGRCPVHRTLDAGVRIEREEVGSGDAGG